MEALRHGIVVFILFLLARFGNLKADDDVATKIRKSINSLSITLFNELASTGRNVFISPLAFSLDLNLLLLGAADDTANELLKTLGYTDLGLTQEQAQDALQSFLIQLRGDKGASQMLCTNSIWIQSGSNVSPSYTSAVQKYFFAQEKEVDFGNPAATSTINNWINQQTNGKISKIFDSDLDKTTKIALASAQYFKGSWAVSFDPSKTKEEPFYVNAGQTTAKVEMMQMDGNFSYVADIDTNSEFVEIPFDGKNLSMIIALPMEVDGLQNQEKHFTAENVYRAIAGMGTTQVHLRIPKFSLSYTGNLNENLKQLGIQKVFIPGQADLSGIDGKQDLNLSNFTEKVMIEVDETGTQAPPTYVIPKGTATSGYEFPKVVYFTADHPFGFLIRDIPSGTIIFIGRVLDP